MIQTIYKCDKCGHEQHTPEQFWTVGVTADCWGMGSKFVPDKSLQVCRPCLEHLGIYPRQKTIESPTYAPPSLEELIREILARVEVQA